MMGQLSRPPQIAVTPWGQENMMDIMLVCCSGREAAARTRGTVSHRKTHFTTAPASMAGTCQAGRWASSP